MSASQLWTGGERRFVGAVRWLRLSTLARRLPVARLLALRHYRDDAAERLWVPPGHFYSPTPSPEDVEAYRLRAECPVPDTLPGIELRLDGQLQLLSQLRRFCADQPFTAEPRAGLRYYFENGIFEYADAMFLYCFLRHLRPRRVVEVGSGFSSAVMLDTVELFLDSATRLTLVEPWPERLLRLVKPGDLERAELIRERVQCVDPAVFAELESGDVLFVDSTHVTKLGSDVNHCVFEILPRLRPGVFVHFHDVFYPFDYPVTWFEEGRAWNEAYLLRAFLSFNPAYEIVLFNDLVARRHREVLERDFPVCLKNTGASLWLRRTAAVA